MSADKIQADSNHNEFPEYMLDKNQQADSENVALFEAALRNDLSGLHKAIGRGGKVDYFHRKEDSKNALHVAAEGGYAIVVDALLKHGAHANAVAVSGHDTALTLCAHSGHTEVARMLLDHGADVRAGNGYGNTALHEACHSGRCADLVRLLLEKGADVNAQNNKGSTPLHFLCYGEDHKTYPEEMVRLLLEAGADVNRRDNRGMTAILVCCASGRGDLIDVLMGAGGDPTERDSEGRSAHAIAVFYNQERLAKRFAEESPASRFDHRK